MYGERKLVDDGGLMFYGASLADLCRYAAVYADKILKGAEQPARFELIVNLKAARAVGLRIPQSLLLHADEAVQ